MNQLTCRNIFSNQTLFIFCEALDMLFSLNYVHYILRSECFNIIAYFF